MKKSLIALAVAGAFAAPAFAATSNVDVYGSMRIMLQDTDVVNTDMDVVDGVSRIGFKGSEDLGGGLKAIWQIEQQLNATQENATAFGNSPMRNTFVGLSGGFGTVVMGRHDTPYKLGTLSLDIFGDTIADYDGTTLDGVDLVQDTHDARAANAVAYISPTWSGFHFAAAVVPSMDTGATTSGAGLNSGDTIDAFSATAIYKNGPLFASLSYQKVEVLDSPAWKIGASYTFGDLTVGALYEDLEVGAADRSSWLVNAKYNMGPISLKAQYGQADELTGADEDALALGVDYAMSKRTTLFAVYAKGDSDATAGDVTGWNLGVKHDF